MSALPDVSKLLYALEQETDCLLSLRPSEDAIVFRFTKLENDKVKLLNIYYSNEFTLALDLDTFKEVILSEFQRKWNDQEPK